MLRSLVLTFALLATGVAAAQTNPGSPNPLPPLPGSNPSPPNSNPANAGPLNTDPAAAYASVPPAFAPGVPAPPRDLHVVRISGGVMAGQVENRVEPVYPAKARTEHIQGSVVLAVKIGKDGVVRDLQAISGPLPLRDAAIDAVKQWTYKVYRLNGHPVEVLTTVRVNFHLNPGSTS